MSTRPTADLRYFPKSKWLQSGVPLKDVESAALNRRYYELALESSAPGHSLHSGAAGTLAWEGNGVFL